ncbi:MAG: hypothetical protein WD269_00930 [Acidimicrobiia bacterium]
MLPPLTDAFAPTRDALHQVAFYALAPARYAAVGRMGLRPTASGFGTPEFAGRVARVESDLLVHETGDGVATRTITSVRDAADFFGPGYRVDWFGDFRDPPAPADPDAPLGIDVSSATAISDWFWFGQRVLERFGFGAAVEDEVVEIQLWPEHFDLALEAGSADKGRRASYGASPGDRHHDLPYVYVAAWDEIDRSNPFWKDQHFNGASLGYGDLASSDDHEQTALDFLIEGYRILHTR